jgi:murein DD-endopeptidase MepM/ murein hydrolase activator NlpD
LGGGNHDLGAPVYATHNGKVVQVGLISEDNNPGGNRVKIQSTDGTIATYYMHLNTINVNIGDYIAEGTQIGTIGGSGYGMLNKYSAHLHYELFIDSQHVNPVLDNNKTVLIDPARLNEPVHLGTIESSIIVAPKKILESNIELIKLVAPVKSTLNIYPR